MKTFYIPTTTLNFNNILSSESISPKAFYKNRLFGYSRWASIPENPFENSIVLYDQAVFFNRPKSDYEDHPLLLEVVLDEDCLSALTALDEHVFLLDRTIYLNPFTTKIYFFSENERKIALSLSDSSIETKFVRLYQKRIYVVTPPIFTYSLSNFSKEQQSLNLSEIEKDKRINRMKGLLYGYYIGGLLSATLDDVIRINTLREIHNVYAAILTSVDHNANPQQYERLKELYSIIQPEIPLFTKLSKLVAEKNLFDSIISLVREEYGYIRGEIDVNKKIAQLLSYTGQEGKNPVIEEVINLIKHQEYEMAKKVVPVSVLNGELILSEGLIPRLNLSFVPEEDKELYRAWVCDVFSKDEYSGKISTFKEMLSDDVTRKAKEISKTEWKGSYPEITLNSLRRHVRGDEYNHTWKDDIYSALSSVIIRGDDWQKMLRFMQEKMLTDYRLAFSMYGAINGFANLPRDFTDVLFNSDRQYIADVYCEIYGQLLGVDLTTIIKKEPIIIQSSLSIVEDNTPERDSVGDFESLMEEIVTKCSGAKKDKRIYESLFVGCGGLNKAFVDAVCSDTSLNKGKGVQRGIVQLLLKKIKGAKEAKQNNQTVTKTAPVKTDRSLFTDAFSSTGFFLTDFDYLSNNSEFIAIVSRSRKKWMDDLIWFIDAHKPGSQETYYKGKSTDNKTVINQFINFKKGIYRGAKDFLFKTYNING
jgi:hypothetical protein